MLKNYLKVLFRNIAQHKLYSTITILGLTAGILFALVVGIFTWTEMQVNQDLVDVDRLYKLETKFKADNGNSLFVQMPVVPMTKASFPDMIEDSYSFYDRNITISKGEKHLRVQSMIGDSSFLDIFGFKVISGSPIRALSDANSIVITETVAQQFFNRTGVSGETLEIATEGGSIQHFEVSAVIREPMAKNSVTDLVNMDAKAFLPLINASYFSLGTPDFTNWDNGIIAYVKLAKGVSPDKAAKAFNDVIQRHAPPNIAENRIVELVPLTDYYRLTNNGAVQNLIVSLSIIVVFILLLAIFNFVNITISGSIGRLREAGVRKVIGGLKYQLVLQFICESVIYSWMATAAGIALFEIFRDYFSIVLETTLPAIVNLPVAYWLVVVCAATAIGIVAGLYPAIYLSQTQTLESLKGKFRSVGGAIKLSRILVSIQFLLSIFIMIGAVIISNQINYFMEKDLGYEKDAVFVVTSAPRLWTPEGYQKMQVAKRELLRSPAIAAVSLSTGSPSSQFNMMDDIIFPSESAAEQGISAAVTGADEDYATVYGMQMVEGKFFNSEGEPVIPFTVVINEAAQKSLNVKLGDELKFGTNPGQGYKIAGIVRDFNFETLHQAVRPAVFIHSRDYLTFRFYSVRFNAGDMATNIKELESAWHTAFPDDAFVGSFADERLQQRYKTEIQLKRSSTIASVLMIVIVMTGVLGLVALTVAKRTKEIGIRKVLGASISQLVGLVGREYAIVMIIAFAIAMPLSYLFVTDWLSVFVYRITLQWWMFCIPAAFIFLLTMLIVVLQSVGVAIANPVKSLRYE